MDTARIAYLLLAEFKRQVEARKTGASQGEIVGHGYVDDSDFPEAVTLDGAFDFRALADAIVEDAKP